MRTQIIVEPELYPEAEAGRILGRSPSWMRMKRQRDLALVAAGEQPTGPAWVVIGKAVLYRLADLRKWIDANAVERGRVEFDRTKP